MTWIDLMKQIRSNINVSEDPETLMQVYQQLHMLATEAHLRARKLELNSGR